MPTKRKRNEGAPPPTLVRREARAKLLKAKWAADDAAGKLEASVKVRNCCFTVGSRFKISTS